MDEEVMISVLFFSESRSRDPVPKRAEWASNSEGQRFEQHWGRRKSKKY